MFNYAYMFIGFMRKDTSKKGDTKEIDETLLQVVIVFSVFHPLINEYILQSFINKILIIFLRFYST